MKAYDFYWELLERMADGCFYLWGPIQNALLSEFLEGKPKLLGDMFYQAPLTPEQAMPKLGHDLLFQVVCLASRDHPAKVREFLLNAVEAESEPAKKSSDEQRREAQMLIARLAGEFAVGEVLVQLMLAEDEDVRRTAVHSTFFLWQREMADATLAEDAMTPEEWEMAYQQRMDESVAIGALRRLADPQEIHHLVLPSAKRLSSALEFSISILFEDYANAHTQAFLRETWAKILRKVLVQQSEGSGRSKRIIRTVVARVGVNAAVRIAKNLEEEGGFSVYDIGAMEQFFKSPDDKVKERLASLVPYLNPHRGKLSEIEQDLTKVALSRDLLSNYLMLAIVSARCTLNPQEALPVIHKLFERVKDVVPGLPAIPMLIIALSGSMDGLKSEQIDPEVLNIQEQIIKYYQKTHKSTCVIWRSSYFLNRLKLRGRQTELQFRYSGLSSYPQYAKKKHDRVDGEGVLSLFMEEARNGDLYDLERIHHYFMNVAVPGHPKYRDMKAILECLEPALKIAFDSEILAKKLEEAETAFRRYGFSGLDQFLHQEPKIPARHKQVAVVQADLIHALAVIKVNAPEAVDAWMAKNGLDRAFRKKVDNRVGGEPLASIVKGRAVFFVRDVILLRPDERPAQMFERWFRRAPSSKSLSQWISGALMELSNELCGEELFYVPRPQDKQRRAG